MQQLELDYSKAQINAENGMNVAVLNTESHCPGWPEDAFRFVCRFAAINRGLEFMAENVRKWAYENGLEVPKDEKGKPKERAWGGVIVKATRAGIIKSLGLRKTSNVNAHGANAAYYTA